jgi:serine protease DegQ
MHPDLAPPVPVRPDEPRPPDEPGDPQPAAVPELESGSVPPRRRARSWGLRGGLFIAGVIAAFLAVAVDGALFPPPAGLTQQDVNDSIASALASQTPGPALSEAAYAAIQPSLVLIEASSSAAPAASPSPSPTPSPAPSGSGGASPAPSAAAPLPSIAPGTSLGSGVIIDDAGDIMTSLHVVAGASTIQVTFADGSTSSAQIVQSQTDKDIAVLQPGTPPANFTPATLGNPGGLRIGSEAYVVGNPFGLAGSMSAGIVSGLDRTFQTPDGGPLLTGLIQVDAAVNPGNSGGPLVDRNGRVLGIVTGLVNPTKQDVFIGIELAVPIDQTGGGPGGPPQY